MDEQMKGLMREKGTSLEYSWKFLVWWGKLTLRKRTGLLGSGGRGQKRGLKSRKSSVGYEVL